jgi:uncharacterized protein YecE (DUF72 family)
MRENPTDTDFVYIYMIDKLKFEDSYIRIGTSSFSSNDWIGPFYPEKTAPADFLRFYANHFNTVEIDATYYAVPSRQTVIGWKEKTPDSFRFAAKFPRSIVHAGKDSKPDIKKLLAPDFAYEERDKFLSTIRELGEKLGPLLLQFPYFSKREFDSPQPFFEKLDSFLDKLPKNFRYAVEIRNRQWLTREFADICRNHNTALALVDHAWMPHGDEIDDSIDPITADFSYIRLIGDRNGIENITKSWDKEVINRDDRIRRWAAILEKMAGRKQLTFAFINNHFAGHAPATARKLWDIYQFMAKS